MPLTGELLGAGVASKIMGKTSDDIKKKSDMSIKKVAAMILRQAKIYLDPHTRSGNLRRSGRIEDRGKSSGSYSTVVIAFGIPATDVNGFPDIPPLGPAINRRLPYGF